MRTKSRVLGVEKEVCRGGDAGSWKRKNSSQGTESLQSACSAGDPGSIPGSRRCSGEGNGNPFQYSCLENPMDRGAWEAIVHGVAKSWT